MLILRRRTSPSGELWHGAAGRSMGLCVSAAGGAAPGSRPHGQSHRRTAVRGHGRTHHGYAGPAVHPRARRPGRRSKKVRRVVRQLYGSAHRGEAATTSTVGIAVVGRASQCGARRSSDSRIAALRRLGQQVRGLHHPQVAPTMGKPGSMADQGQPPVGGLCSCR